MAKRLEQDYLVRDKGSAVVSKATGKIQDDLRKTEAASSKATASMQQQWTKVAGVIAATFGVMKLASFTNEVIQTADRLDKMSQSLGVSVEWLDKARQAAELGGTDLEAFGTAVTVMTRNLGLAAVGTGRQAEALRELGLSARQLQAAGPEKALQSIAAAALKLQDPLRRNQILMDLLGRSGTALVPMLKDVASGFDGLNAAISTETAIAAANFNDTMFKLKVELQALVAENILPALNEALRVMGPYMKEIATAAGILVGVALSGWFLKASFSAIALFGALITQGGIGLVKAIAMLRTQLILLNATLLTTAGSIGKLKVILAALKTAVLIPLLAFFANPVVLGITAVLVTIGAAWLVISKNAKKAKDEMEASGKTMKEIWQQQEIERVTKDITRLEERIDSIRKTLADPPGFHYGMTTTTHTKWLEDLAEEAIEAKDRIEELRKELEMLSKEPVYITIVPAVSAYTVPGVDADAHVETYNIHRQLIKDQETVRRIIELSDDAIHSQRVKTQEAYTEFLKAEEEKRAAIYNQVGVDADAHVELFRQRALAISQLYDTIAESFSSNFVNAFDALHDTWDDNISTLKNLENAFLNFASTFLREMARMIAQQMIFNALRGAMGGLGGATGNFMGKLFGLEGFARGGVVTGPTPALIGEGGQNEAVVPLPDGRSIPVSLNNRGQSQIVINMNAPVSSRQDARLQARMITEEIKKQMDGRISYQTKPGGILNPQPAF